MITPPSFTQRARDAVRDDHLRSALDSATRRFSSGRIASLAELPDAGTLRDRGRAIRRTTLEKLDEYLAELADNVTAAGGHVHWAADDAEACRIVSEIAVQSGAKLAVKSKSMTSEEIGLNHALDALGIQAVETDLGEWIIQLAGEPPSHIIAPAVHKTIGDVVTLFEAATGADELPAEIPALTAVARQALRQQFLDAGIGISGVNFAVAESGTALIVTNEGNARLVSSLPPVHVAIMGIEKVVPRWDDVAVLLPLLTRSATGQRLTSYVTAITGPRRAGEIDGPQEFHLVILDNGRSDVLADDYREALACIRCGACLNVCPVYTDVGGHAYGATYSGPIGAVITPLLAGLGEAPELPFASSLCGACLEACPMRIDLPRMLVALRNDAVERSIEPRTEGLAFRAFSWLVVRRWAYELGARVGRLVQQLFVRDEHIASAPPPLAAWTRYRDFPPLAEESFLDRWRREPRDG